MKKKYYRLVATIPGEDNPFEAVVKTDEGMEPDKNKIADRICKNLQRTIAPSEIKMTTVPIGKSGYNAFDDTLKFDLSTAVSAN